MATTSLHSVAAGWQRPGQVHPQPGQKLADLVSKFEGLEKKPKRPSVPSEVKLKPVNTKPPGTDASSLSRSATSSSQNGRVEAKDSTQSSVKSQSLHIVREKSRKESLHSSGITKLATWKLQPKVEIKAPTYAKGNMPTSVAERRKAFEWIENGTKGINRPCDLESSVLTSEKDQARAPRSPLRPMAKSCANLSTPTKAIIFKSTISIQENENSSGIKTSQEVQGLSAPAALVNQEPRNTFQDSSLRLTTTISDEIQQNQLIDKNKSRIEDPGLADLAGVQEQAMPSYDISTTPRLPTGDEHVIEASMEEKDKDIMLIEPSKIPQHSAGSPHETVENQISTSPAASSLNTPIFTEDEIEILFSKLSEEPDFGRKNNYNYICSSKSHGALLHSGYQTDTGFGSTLPRSATTEIDTSIRRHELGPCCQQELNKRESTLESKWTKGWFPRRDRGQRPSLSHQVAHADETKKAPARTKETIGLFESLTYKTSSSVLLSKPPSPSSFVSSELADEMPPPSDTRMDKPKATSRGWSGSWNRRSQRRGAGITGRDTTKHDGGSRKRKTWTAGIAKADLSDREDCQQIDSADEGGPKTRSKRIISSRYWSDRIGNGSELAPYAAKIQHGIREIHIEGVTQDKVLFMEADVNSIQVPRTRARRWFSRSTKNIVLGSTAELKTPMPRRGSEVRRIISLCKGKVVGHWQETDDGCKKGEGGG